MSGAKKKILVVEDEDPIRRALKDTLISEKFDVLEAKDGKRGLAVALKERPDLILLDIIMPKMDGMTMMRELRKQDEWGKDVPIILLTNLSATEGKIIKGIVEDEPSYYLVKSDWKVEDVVKGVKATLEEL